MPEKRTLERARRKARQGKSASTVAGEFVREEIEDIRKGKHGARSTKQAIAIGLSKARRAGVALKPPKTGSRQTKQSASETSAVGSVTPGSNSGGVFIFQPQHRRLVELIANYLAFLVVPAEAGIQMPL